MLATSLALPRRPDLGDPPPHQPRGVHRVRKSCVILRSMVTARYLIQQATSLAVSEARSTQQTTNFAETKAHFEQQLINFPTSSARFEQQQTVSVHASSTRGSTGNTASSCLHPPSPRDGLRAFAVEALATVMTQSLHLAVITRF